MTESMNRTIRLTFLFQALMYASLWMPIWVVYMAEGRHLTLSEVYLIAGVGWIVQAAAEIPTGVISDSYGRRTTLVLGAFTVAAGLFLFAMLPGFAGQLAAYVVWAVGNALISGSDDALLFDAAAAAGREEEFESLASRSMQITLVAQAVGSLSGGAAAAFDLRAPILITAALSVVGVVVATRLTEPPRRADPGGGPGATELSTEARKMGSTLATAARYVRGRPRLLMLLAYTGLLSSTAFFVPFVLFQPQMQSYAIPVAWFGVMFMGLRLAALAGSRYGPMVVGRFGGARVWLLLAPVLLVLAFLAVALAPTWPLAYASMLLVALVNAIVRPTTSAILNHALTGRIRATILSAESLVMTVFIALMHPAVGVVADRVSISASFVLLAVVALLPAVLSASVRRFAAGVHESQGPSA